MCNSNRHTHKKTFQSAFVPVDSFLCPRRLSRFVLKHIPNVSEVVRNPLLPLTSSIVPISSRSATLSIMLGGDSPLLSPGRVLSIGYQQALT